MSKQEHIVNILISVPSFFKMYLFLAKHEEKMHHYYIVIKTVSMHNKTSTHHQITWGLWAAFGQRFPPECFQTLQDNKKRNNPSVQIQTNMLKNRKEKKKNQHQVWGMIYSLACAKLDRFDGCRLTDRCTATGSCQGTATCICFIQLIMRF